MNAFEIHIPSEGAATHPPTWRPVPGHEANYQVSDLGDVRSLPRPRTKGGLLQVHVGRAGYLKVSLSSNGRQESRLVHQIVAAAFLGPRPDGQEVRHLDGNRLNCALSNLAYGTRSENERDKLRHGTDHNARKTHCPQGHPYDEANTYHYGSSRGCRACNRTRPNNSKPAGGVSTSPLDQPGGTR